jgi:hypothetical protein
MTETIPSSPILTSRVSGRNYEIVRQPPIESSEIINWYKYLPRPHANSSSSKGGLSISDIDIFQRDSGTVISFDKRSLNGGGREVLAEYMQQVANYLGIELEQQADIATQAAL